MFDQQNADTEPSCRLVEPLVILVKQVGYPLTAPDGPDKALWGAGRIDNHIVQVEGLAAISSTGQRFAEFTHLE
jgi:hypothetical protein